MIEIYDFTWYAKNKYKKRGIMLVISILFIFFLLITFFIIFLVPNEYHQYIFPTMTGIFMLVCQSFYQTYKKKELEKFKNTMNKNLEEYKNKIDREIEHYKSKLENSNLVTKMQYELEFSIYKELYADVMHLYENYDKENSKKLSENLSLKNFQYLPFVEKSITEDIGLIIISIQSSDYKTNDIFCLKLSQLLYDLASKIKSRIENMQIIH